MIHRDQQLLTTNKLEDVLVSDELSRRPVRSMDVMAENATLLSLAQILATSPERMFDHVAASTLKICRAGSAGVNLIIPPPSGNSIWKSVTGDLSAMAGQIVSSDNCPTSAVVDRNELLLFAYPQRYYRFPIRSDRPIVELLMAPVRLENRAVGAVWACAHDPYRTFDQEDARSLRVLATFVSAALPLIEMNPEKTDRSKQSSAQHRATELSQIKVLLNHEILQRSQAEATLAETQAQLEAALETINRLQRLGTRLLVCQNVRAGLSEIIDAILVLLNADLATLRLFNESDDEVEATMQRSGGLTFRINGRIATAQAFAQQHGAGPLHIRSRGKHRDHARSHAASTMLAPGKVTSVLLWRRGGSPLGILSIYFHKSSYSEPSADRLRLLDLHVRQAADFIERIQAESALAASEQHYRLMVNEIKDYAIFLLNEHGEIETWDAGAEILFGFSKEEIIGRNCEILYTREDRLKKEPQMQLAEARQTHRTENEQWYLRKNDIHFWGASVTKALRDSGGSLVGFVKLVRDLTEQRLSEEDKLAELLKEQSARREAETVNRMKDEFLANLSHELRTPMSAIVGWARLLQMADLAEADKRHGLDAIERNSNIQVKLIDDLLDMSRIVSGKIQLQVEPFDLQEVVKAVAETVQPAIVSKNIQFAMAIEPLSGFVKGDSSRIEQCVGNILANAVKFTPADGKITVKVWNDETHACVQVTDNGLGIDPSFLPYVFDRFRQGDTSMNRQFGGLGLGLSIVRQIIELHNGMVAAQSSGKGLGSTFTIRLPLEPLESSGIYQQKTLRLASPVSLEGARILVIDDQADMRNFVTNLLSICGCHVFTASSCKEGLEQFRNQKPAVVLTDIGMPGEDGFFFLREARRIASERGWCIPTVAMTAFASRADQDRTMASGFQAHLSKPVDPTALVTLLDELISKEFSTNEFGCHVTGDVADSDCRRSRGHASLLPIDPAVNGSQSGGDGS